MDRSAPGDVASVPGTGPLADSAAALAAAAAARSSEPVAAPVVTAFACGAHCAMRLATCPNVTLCSAAMCAHAWRNVPSSHRSVRVPRPVARAKTISHEALLTDPPIKPQSLTSLAQSRPVTASASIPALPPEPYPAKASKDLRSANAAADSAKPAGTSGAGRELTVPLSSLTRLASSSNSSKSTCPSPSTSKSSKSSPALDARTPSRHPMSASATETSPKSR